MIVSTIAGFEGFSDVPGFCGPFEDSGSSDTPKPLYCFLADRTGGFFEPWGSTDGGATWSQLGGTGLSASWVATVRVVQDVAGRKLWIVTPDTATGGLIINWFDLVTLTFGTVSAPGPVPDSFGSGAIFANFTLTRRSDDTFVATISYNNGGENIAEYLYDLSGLGGWDPVFKTPTLPVGASVNAIQSSLISGSGSDLTHNFTWASYILSVDIRDYTIPYYFGSGVGLLVNGVNDRIANQPVVGKALSWDNSGTWQLAIPYMQIDDLRVIECTDDDPPASISDTLLGTLSAGFGSPLSSAVLFGGARYVIATIDGMTGNDIVYWVDSGSGWTGPVTVLHTLNCFNLSAQPVGSGIGVVFDDFDGVGESIVLNITKFLYFVPGAANEACRYRGYLIL